MSNIKSIIDEWDPAGILLYAPSDEYHFEIAEIERLFNSTKDVFDLAEGIYSVFIESFGEEIFQKNKDECFQIAKKIYSQS